MFEMGAKRTVCSIAIFLFPFLFTVNNLLTETSIILENVVLINSHTEMKNKTSYKDITRHAKFCTTFHKRDIFFARFPRLKYLINLLAL